MINKIWVEDRTRDFVEEILAEPLSKPDLDYRIYNFVHRVLGSGSAEQSSYDKGYNEGYDAGVDDGYEEGYDEGQNDCPDCATDPPTSDELSDAFRNVVEE